MRVYDSIIVVALWLTSCVSPGKYFSETRYFSEKCLTCKNRENDDLGICFVGHWIKYTESDSSQTLSIVIARPILYKYNKSWLVAKNHKRYYIVPLYDDSLAIHSYKKFKNFKTAFSDYLIPDSLILE